MAKCRSDQVGAASSLVISFSPSESEETIVRLAREYPDAAPSTIVISIRVRNVVAEFHRALDLHFERFGLSMARFGILIFLYDHAPGYPPSEIARKLGVSRGNLTPIVAHLEKKKWITKKHHQLDRRTFDLQLSDEGRTMMKNFLPVHFRRMRVLYSTLQAKDLEDLDRSIGKFREGINLLVEQVIREDSLPGKNGEILVEQVPLNA